MFIQIITTQTDTTTDTTTDTATATTTGIPAVIIGSMTLPIEKGLHTGTEQRASASILLSLPGQEPARAETVQQEGSRQSHPRQELARTEAVQQAGSQQSHPHQELVLQRAVIRTAVFSVRTWAPGEPPVCNGKAPSHPGVESKDKWGGLPLREIILSKGSAMEALNAGQANAGA